MKAEFSMKSHLKRWWYLYFISFLCISAIYPYFVSLKNRAKDYEKFSLFIAASSNKTNKIEEGLKDTFGDGVIEYTIDAISPGSIAYYQVKSARGLSADLMIYPKSEVEKMAVSTISSFLPVPSAYAQDGDYLVEQTHYGRAVAENKTGLFSDLLFYEDEPYYLFISSNSVHLGGLKDGGKTENILKFLKRYCS